MTLVRDAMQAVEPRFPGREFLAFDALTAAGFVAFRDAAVDVQIVEVGLGGLLDSTNVFGRSSADGTYVVVLTPISMEHTAILGDTIAAIARAEGGDHHRRSRCGGCAAAGVGARRLPCGCG